MAGFCFGGFTGFDCSLLYIVMILLFFLAAIFRKQVAENLGIDFTLIGSTALAEGAFIIIIILFSSMKWGFLAGLIGLLIGGFALAPFLPDSEGGGEY
jgi:hypothetical protein